MEGYYEIGAVEFYKICLCYLRSNMKFCSVTHVLNPNLKKVITIFLSGRVFFVLQRDSNILRLKCDGTRAETMFRLSAKRTSPFISARGGGSVQSTTGSRGVRISGSNAGYTMF